MQSHKFKLGDLAARIAAELRGDPECEITGVASLASAKAGQLTFLLGGNYRKFLPTTGASAVILTAEDADDCPTNALVVGNPEVAFAKLLSDFEIRSSAQIGIHSSATIGENCDIHDSVTIAAGCHIGNDVKIGANAVILQNTVIGDRVSIGADFCAHANVVIYHDVTIGDRVTLYSGAVIGADGFGLTNDNGQWLKIPQLGSVQLGNDVDIGANSAIDRGALDDTVIEDGVKIDNLVQIAHNVHVGAHTIIAGCVGVAGSTQIGRHCMIGGGACLNGHIKIADQVVISGMAMVLSSITKPGLYSSGTGLQTYRDWRKSAVRFQQLDDIVRRIKKLEGIYNEL